jgi:hypothetical protein
VRTTVAVSIQPEYPKGRERRIAAITMVILGAVMLLTWAAFIATGVLDQGIRTIERSEHGQYLAFHLVAETAMAVLLIAGGAGLLLKASWALPVAFLGLGMTVYSTVNSLSHTVRNEPALTPVLLVSLAIAVAVIVLLRRMETQTSKGFADGSEPTGPGSCAGITTNAGGEAG